MTTTETETPAAPEAVPGGRWAEIAFFGHIEHTGYVTDITRHGGIAAYRIDLPEKLWGGNELAFVEYAASAWFGETPLTEDAVRTGYEARVRQAEARARQAAEWQRLQDQRALEAGRSSDEAYAEAQYENDAAADLGDSDDDDDQEWPVVGERF